MLTGDVATDGTGNAAQMLIRLSLPGAIVIGGKWNNSQRSVFLLCHQQTFSSEIIYRNRIAQNR